MLLKKAFRFTGRPFCSIFYFTQTTFLFLVPEIIKAKKSKSRLFHVFIVILLSVEQKYGTILIIQGVLSKNILFLIKMVIY